MCFSSCTRVQSTQENWLLGSDLCDCHASARSVRQSCLGVTKQHLNIYCDANESGILVKKKAFVLHCSESLVQLVSSF
jgi:hypothetical protein